MIRKESKSKTSPTRLKQTKILPTRKQTIAKAVPNNEERDVYDELDYNIDADACDEPCFGKSEELSELDQTVKYLLDEEEQLLNMHMSAIQENAELLTEEGQLLQSVQGKDYDIDHYASRLGVILDRKAERAQSLRERLGSFRDLLQKEEELSKKVGLESNF